MTTTLTRSHRAHLREDFEQPTRPVVVSSFTLPPVPAEIVPLADVCPAVPAAKPARVIESADEKLARLMARPGCIKNVTEISAEVLSATAPDTYYLVFESHDAIECDCKAGKRGVCCWHIRAYVRNQDGQQTAVVATPSASESQIIEVHIDNRFNRYACYGLTKEISDVTTTTAGDTAPVFENVIPAGSEYVGAVEARSGQDDKPHKDWVRGTCPECGGQLVSNAAYVGGRGYLTVFVCWEALAEQPQCSYQRVLGG